MTTPQTPVDAHLMLVDSHCAYSLANPKYAAESRKLVEASARALAAIPAQREAVSSIDHAQRKGHFGEPAEWREACRLYRSRCDSDDVKAMAKLHAYIEDGLLEVRRPSAPTPPTAPAQDAQGVAKPGQRFSS